MQSIVHGLRRRYEKCMQFENVDIHGHTARLAQLRPFGTPEFYLLDGQDQVLHVWLGLTEAEEFETVFRQLCAA